MEDELSLDEMAQLVVLTTAHFTRIFRKQVNGRDPASPGFHWVSPCLR